MKYEKCLTCKQLGTTCDGPNFLAMDTVELGLWCNEKRKLIPGMTYDKTAAETRLSKTTVYSFLTGAHPDCRIETVRPILKLYTGGKWDDNPCGNLDSTERVIYEEKIRQLESEISRRDEKIAHLEQSNAHLTQNHGAMQTLIANTNARHTQDKDFLRKQLEDRYYFLKRKDRVIVILSVFLGLSLLAIISALIMDMINPDMGFFWLRSWLGGNAGTRG